LKSNWENHLFQLEYEVLNDVEAVEINDSILSNWTKSFFICLDQAIEAFQENHLSITIQPQSDGVRFFFDFSGIIIKKELIEQFLNSSEMDVIVKEFSENELGLEVFMSVM
jgi:stage 0 sporulation protein B (sporulation initiation phosphotransferase)